MKHTLWTVAAVTLLALPVWGANWTKHCVSSGTAVTGLQPTGVRFACTRPSDNSTDSPIIDVTACDNVDWMVYDDEDGDGTASASLTHTLQHCPPGLANNTTDAVQDAACVTFTSGGTHTGTGETLGIGAGRLKIVYGGTFTASSDPMDVLVCH